MDFLKTLLAYMAIMATLGAQEGPAIDQVPTPTPLPPSVTATLVPHQTQAPTATPTLSPAPVPTITPNYRYDTLKFGNSGNQVRKLQRALIELGFLPSGSDDSQYGYQTYNAVKAFQKANGLSADGVAGPATLTNLYENPNVLGPAKVTEVPTATPTPTLEPIPTPPPQEEFAPVVTPAPVADDFATLGWQKIDGGLIISGNTGEALFLQQVIGGQQALVKPGLWKTADGVALKLRDLADCMPGWTLAGSAADATWTLTASGYTVVISLTDELTVTVDGAPITTSAANAALIDGELYITNQLLIDAIGAQTVYDTDERSLVLILTDKTDAASVD